MPRLQTVAGFVLFIVLGALFASLGAVLPALRTEFGMSANAGSELVSIFQIGSLIATATCGILARRLPGRLTMSVLIVSAVVAATAMSLAPTWSTMLVAAVFGGLGFGGLVLYLNTAFACGYGPRSLLMLNLLNAAFMVGSIAGPLTIGALGDQGRNVFLGIGILALISWPASGLAKLVPVRTAGKRGDATESSRRYLPIFVSFVAIGLLYAATETGVGTWESTHLVSIGYSMSAAASLTALFWAGHAVGRVTLPFLSSRGAPAKLIVACLALTAVALASASLPGAAPYAYGAAGILLGPVFPTLLVWLSSVTPTPQSSNAVMLTALMIGSAGSPALISSIIGERSGAIIPITLSMLALGCTIAVLVAARVAAGRERPVAVPEPVLATSTAA